MQNKNLNLVKVGQKIKLLRQEKGLSQEQFAAEASVDRSYMGGIERGERNISTLNLIRLAKALNVEVGELFPKMHDMASD